MMVLVSLLTLTSCNGKAKKGAVAELEEVAAQVDAEVKNIVETQYELAKKLLTENKDVMEAIVKVLLEKETLEESEVDEIMKNTIEHRNGNEV